MKFVAEIEINGAAFGELDKEQIKKLLTNCSIVLKEVDIPTYGTESIILRELCEEDGLDDWRLIDLASLYEKEIMVTLKVLNCLNDGGIMTLGELADATVEQLRGLPKFDQKALEEVQEMLVNLDLRPKF